MQRITLETMGQRLAAKRGSHGIRETAKEIGISPATLSRVERGNMPDLQTFKRICDWLEIDPGTVLGSKTVSSRAGMPPISVHFKKDSTLTKETAKDLAYLVLAAQRAMELIHGTGNG